MPAFSLQPVLETETLQLLPLQATDFQDLYAVAADPHIWAQHPNKDRWQRPIFTTFFEGAIQSQGAFKIVDKATGATLGSTRLYDLYYAGQVYLHRVYLLRNAVLGKRD